MTRKGNKNEVLRWILAGAGVVAAFFAALFFSLFLLIFSSFPKDLAGPTAGFLMGLAVVLAGAGLAPRKQLVTALVLLVGGTPLIAFGANLRVDGVLGGGAAGVALVGWWFHPRRTKRSIVWVGSGAGVAFLIFLGVVQARFVDRPARPEELAPRLANVLGTNATLVTAFYSYDKGGFIDHEWLWRIDAAPETIAVVIGGFGLRSTNSVPQAFWRMGPHYWPRSLPTGGEVFQSPNFEGNERGSDGTHYFLVHDRAQGRAFVWVKDNF